MSYRLPSLGLLAHHPQTPIRTTKGKRRIPRFGFSPGSSGILLTLAILLVFPGICLAGSTPVVRGPGFYFSLFKLILVGLAYFGWMSTANWVSEDIDELEPAFKPLHWNGGMFIGGLAGFLTVWLTPIFPLGFLGLLAMAFGPALAYSYLRNQEVNESDKVLTPNHFRKLAWKYLGLNLGYKGPGGRKEKAIPLRFHGKTSGRANEDSTLNRAEGSAGYRAALEMVYEAIEMRATDIHMEPTKDEMTVRYRIDGILQRASPFSREMGDAVLNIFKVLASLDITEKRKPQDGSFSGEMTNRPKSDDLDSSNLLDFRVATAGGVTGEKLVMRILDRSNKVSSLSDIGMRDRLIEKIKGVVTQPHGMFIVCGPTGAGKSTTLYAALSEIDRYQKNVISVENPVEYHLANVTQIEINPKAGKTFASELRSILRQDPDVIYIGEIRDQETAEIACQAAQTGHLVLTTLHANDTVTAISRLLDLGVQPFLVANAVTAVLGQRLVRVLCPKCKQRYKPNEEILSKANLPVEKIKYFFRPPPKKDDDSVKECEYCGGRGYRGRTGVFEFLEINDRMKSMIRDNPNLEEIRREAIKNGMKLLQQDGIRQVIDGETSIGEIDRVCK